MDIIEVLPAATERLAGYPPWSATAKPGSTPSSSKSFAVLTPTRCGLLDVRPHDDGRRGDRTAGIFPDKWYASTRSPDSHTERREERERSRRGERQGERGSPSGVIPQRGAIFEGERRTENRCYAPHPNGRAGNGCAAGRVESKIILASILVHQLWTAYRSARTFPYASGKEECRYRLRVGNTATRPTLTNATLKVD